jgi:hypothetical protein
MAQPPEIEERGHGFKPRPEHFICNHTIPYYTEFRKYA